MSAAETLELMRKLAPLYVLLLLIGIGGGVYAIRTAKKRSIYYVGVGLSAFCTLCLVTSIQGLMILYLG